MTLAIAPANRSNSSTTLPDNGAVAAGRRPGPEGFSVLMRMKQEAGRMSASPAGEQGERWDAAASGSQRIIGTITGPQADPALLSPPCEETQTHGREAQEEPRLDGLSPWVDPLQRVLAHSAWAHSEATASPVTHPALAMDQLWRAVRRMAWGGDRQRSVAYIELGSGTLAGAALMLEARGQAISVVVDLPPGASHAGWAERLTDRLARRGLEVLSVEVR